MTTEPPAGTQAIHLLTHEFPPFTGGIAVYAEETALALARLGARLTVWAPGYGTAGEPPAPYAVRRVPMRGKQGWTCRFQLARALRQAFPDGRIAGTVVLAEPGPIRLWMYRRLLNLPRPDRLVVLLHGSEVQGLSGVLHRRQLFRQLLLSADRVGVVSSAVGQAVERLCPELQGRLARVPGAVRSACRDFPPVERDYTRTPLDILQVGRIHPRKGQHHLLRAAALLPDDLRGRIRIRLAGPATRPRYAAQLQALARASQLPVDFAGTLSDADLRLAYQRAALLVLPSQPFRASVEGLGLALLEAQHFGCPVIASRTGGTPEALRVGVSGLLVPPADPHALAAAIASLLADPHRAAAMGRAGAVFVRQAFSWDANVQRLGLV